MCVVFTDGEQWRLRGCYGRSMTLSSRMVRMLPSSPTCPVECTGTDAAPDDAADCTSWSRGTAVAVYTTRTTRKLRRR